MTLSCCGRFRLLRMSYTITRFIWTFWFHYLARLFAIYAKKKTSYFYEAFNTMCFLYLMYSNSPYQMYYWCNTNSLLVDFSEFGKSSGMGCVTFPVATHSTPRVNEMIKPTLSKE